MDSELARVLNVVAHEIRTPLAASQGYLRLLAQGRLAGAEERAHAVERTRQALGKLAALCTDMSRLGALADAPAPVLSGRMPVEQLVADGVVNARSATTPARRGGAAPGHVVRTDGTPDLGEAVRVVAGAAFADAGPTATVVDVAEVGDDTVTVLLGADAAVAAMPRHPEAAGAAALSTERGGHGVSLFWAERVLQRHRVRVWQAADSRAAIGLMIPTEHA